MKKFTIITNRYSESLSLKSKLKNTLIEHGFLEDSERPEIVFTIGGDGTVLKSFQKYVKHLKDTLFFCINNGKVGFLTEFSVLDPKSYINILIEENFNIVKKPLLQVRDGKNVYYALNEARLDSKNRTSTFSVFLNNSQFMLFKGSGINFSTPQGSTGFNRSFGGSVLSPELHAFQMLEIGSVATKKYNSLRSSLILGSNDVIDISMKNRKFVPILLLDAMETKYWSDNLSFSISNEFIKFCVPKDSSFIKKIRKVYI